MIVNEYIVTMKHDKGTVRIAVVASSAEAAAKMVCNFEHAPMSAVLSVKEGQK